jgi:hypothetical protein
MTLPNGVWHRHTVMAVPQKWTMAWMAICGYGLAYSSTPFPLVVVPPGVPWAPRGDGHADEAGSQWMTSASTVQDASLQTTL